MINIVSVWLVAALNKLDYVSVFTGFVLGILTLAGLILVVTAIMTGRKKR